MAAAPPWRGDGGGGDIETVKIHANGRPACINAPVDRICSLANAIRPISQRHTHTLAGNSYASRCYRIDNKLFLNERGRKTCGVCGGRRYNRGFDPRRATNFEKIYHRVFNLKDFDKM